MTVQSNIDLSIVTPCFNEEDTIAKCAAEVKSLMNQVLPQVKYEHIFSDNASSDNTVNILREIARNDSKVKVVVNSRNIGAPKNIYRALSHTIGSSVIPMLPADLQDHPNVIPYLYEKWKLGNLIVFGKRINRQEFFMMRLIRGAYYRLIRKMSQNDIPVNAGDFMLIDRKVVNAVTALREQNPYLRGLVAQTGVKSDFVEYTWIKREGGKSKATPLLLIDTAINGVVSTSRLPARLALLGGFLFSLVGVLLGCWSLISALFKTNEIAQGIPTIIVALFFIGGIQLFFLGLIGEYVLSIHGQIRPEPPVFDSERINFPLRGD